MRRIDLVAKLIAPLLISFVDAASTILAVWTVLGSTLASVAVEYLAIAQVYHTVPELAEVAASSENPMHQATEPLDVEESPAVKQSPGNNLLHLWFDPMLSSWSYYFRSPMFLASLSLSILFLTVLSFNAHMVTYLLALGFSALWVSIFRLVSVIVELGATWAAPVLMSKIGPVRSGLWFITWQSIFAAAGVAMFNMEMLDRKLNAIPLIVGVVLSRIGLWGFDLSVQYLVQEVSLQHAEAVTQADVCCCLLQEIPPSHRSQFSATEAALQNLFEMLSFATTTIWANPQQFKYPAVISVAAIGVANLCFTAFVRKARGHLFHSPGCMLRQKYQRLEQSNAS